jgi:hypothetical protein
MTFEFHGGISRETLHELGGEMIISLKFDFLSVRLETVKIDLIPSFDSA